MKCPDILPRSNAQLSAGEYWAVNQILAKQLHTTDEGILNYTTNLVDKMERVRMPWDQRFMPRG